LEDPDVDGRIILICIFRKWDVGAWTGAGSGPCECGNEPSGSTKCGEFLDWLGIVEILKNDSAPRSK